MHANFIALPKFRLPPVEHVVLRWDSATSQVLNNLLER